MPMIDIYATPGTFQDFHQLAIDAAAVVKGVEGVPDIPLFRKTPPPLCIEIDNIVRDRLFDASPRFRTNPQRHRTHYGFPTTSISSFRSFSRSSQSCFVFATSDSLIPDVQALCAAK